MGKSSYTDHASGMILDTLISNKYIDVNRPILIAGAGYGAGVSELLDLGAHKIYLNDLNRQNLICAKKYIMSSQSEKLDRIEFLPGDINDDDVLSNISNNTLGLVYAKNMIHFFDAAQIDHFFYAANLKLITKGYFIVTFENPFHEIHREMALNILNKYNLLHKNNGHIEYDEIVKKQYSSIAFGRYKKHCSFDDFINTSDSISMPGFPCIIRNNNQFISLLLPMHINSLLKSNGFEIVDDLFLPYDTIMIVAVKSRLAQKIG